MAVEMAAVRRQHKAFVLNLSQLLFGRLAGRALVNVQSGIVLSDDSEPEPDIAVLRRREPPYKEREAHSYAEARMAEYWVVDCTSEVVEIHRGPGPDGYREVRRFSVGAVVSPLAFPDLEVPLAEIFA